MHVSVSEAKSQLTDLVRRAEAGEEVVLTRHGQSVVRLMPLQAPIGPKQRREVIERILARAKTRIRPGPSAARSQDFLYGDDGLPK